jgi:D-beta-D-heptose 7-phosphate kinase/D-beta-D-heptose 1-phosphate adenosyltransferase
MTATHGTNDRMNSLAYRFRSAKVVVIGDVMLDEYVVGTVSRISPEAPVPVLDVRSRFSSPGGAANVAMNVAGLAATVHLVGLAGNDSAGLTLRELLRERSIPDAGLIDAGDRGTILKTRIVAGQQQICRIDHEVTTDAAGPVLESMIDTAKRLIASCSVVVLSDYAKGTLTEHFCEVAISFARELGKLVIVDPKSKSFAKYRGCTVVTPNLAEASLATGVIIDSECSVHKAGNALMEQLPGTSILITRGPDGMTLFEYGSEPVLIPTVARRLFDVVGAGDTAVATLAVALAAGLPIREAVVWANIAAGIVVEKHGTASVSIQELFRDDDTAGLIRSLDNPDPRPMLAV